VMIGIFQFAPLSHGEFPGCPCNSGPPFLIRRPRFFGMILLVLLAQFFGPMRILISPSFGSLENVFLMGGIIFAACFVVSVLVGRVSPPGLFSELFGIPLIISQRYFMAAGPGFFWVSPVSLFLIGVEAFLVGLNPFIATVATPGSSSPFSLVIEVFNRKRLQTFRTRLLHRLDYKLVYEQGQGGYS